MKLTKEGIAVIEGDNYLSADIIAQGRLDVAREWLEQYHKYIPEGGVVVDVGACLGDMTATFSEMVGLAGRVYAFEPNPPVLDCLLFNMSKYKNVSIYGNALGSSQTKASFIIDHHNIGASRLVVDGDGPIYLTTMDSIFDEHLDQLDFMKIDAEGCEPYILDGAQETLKRFRPVMLIEVDQRALGFQRFTPTDVHVRLEMLGDYKFQRFAGAHGDILCVPKERV